jgi:hypothetical protein
MIRDLIVLSVLLIIIFGGLGWTKLMLWEWHERDRSER